ncbi:MAG: hypothetical protein KGD59_16020 [Candidatus Heimdallarchaeota archaeon]|nr:hypothetical protein [Candidatus Heimdallarchaeota archaeon]
MSEEKDTEEIIEETEEPEATLTTEEEEILDEPIEAEETEDEPLEMEETEEIEVEDEEEIETVEDDEEIEVDEELEIPEIPLEVEAEEPLEVEEEFEIPDIPLEVEEEEVIEAKELDAEPEEEEDIVVDEEVVEAEEVKPVKKRKKRKKRSKKMLTGLLVGVIAALVIEVSFSIPLWLNGVSRPDLYYIELVLILIAMTLPGLFSRSVLEGLLGGFLIFLVAFIPPLVLSLAGLNYILNPLTPLFSSVDYSIPAFEAFSSLFPALAAIDFNSVRFWIWIIDLVLMFILVVLVVTIATALIKSITIRKKKAGHWIGIPLLSIGLIIFTIFTPIIFSSTFGIVQASSAFLGGSAKMQDAYAVFDTEGMTTQSLQDFTDLMTDANRMMGEAQINFQGLKNIGLFNLMTIIPNQYGPFIEAGDQLALATLALTDIIVPLFNGIFGLTSSISNATESMAGFGTSPSLILADFSDSGITKNDLADVAALKLKIIAAIDGLTEAEITLTEVQADLAAGDLDEAFDGVNEALGLIDTSKLPAFLSDPISEVIDEISGFRDQITGFSEMLEYTTSSIGPTKNILWTAYNAIEGNEYLKYYKFTDAKNSFQQAVNNVTGLTIDTFTPTGDLSGFVSADLTGDYSDLLNDLLGLMDPLLNEELNYAMTLEGIDTMIEDFYLAPDLTAVDYFAMYSPVTDANTTANFGELAQTELVGFRIKVTAEAYGPTFSSVGADLEDILTKDFKPQEFGQITNNTANALTYFLLGCEEYSIQNFAAATANLLVAEAMVTDVQLILVVSDPQYLQNYLNNWSSVITNIKSFMEINDTPGEFATGLVDINTEFNTLYTATDEQA